MKKILILITALAFFLSPEKVLAQNFPVTVTVGSASKPISKFIWGADYNGYYTYTSADEFINKFTDPIRLKNLGVTMLRYPGGCPSDVYHWQTNEMKGRNFIPDYSKFLSVNEFLKLTDYLQVEPLYTVNINYKTGANVCGDIHVYPGLTPEQNQQKLVQDAVDLVHTYKGRIKYFELGNEQYLTGYTPDEYQAIALPIAQAMKKEDPTIQIGLISFIHYSTDSLNLRAYVTPWINMVKNIVNSQCGHVPCFDYVSTHDYFGVGHGSIIVPYAPLLRYGSAFDNATLDFTPKKIAMTEWNTGNCWEASAGKSSVFWGMFYEEMLLTMAEKGVFIANYHDITGGSQCSLIRQKTTDPWRSAEQIFSLSSVLAGGKILDTNTISPTQNISYKGMNTNVPYITSYAGYSPDGTVLYVFLLNHHPEQNGNIFLDLSAVKTYVQGQIRVDQLSAASLTDYAFTSSVDTIGASNPLTIIIPPISIVRLTIAPRPNLCSSATISSSTLSSGSTVTVITTSNKPVKNFFLAFYNLDNLYGPGNAKPIFFEAGKTFSISKEATSLTQTMSFTINYADINKPDLNNNGQKPTKISVNGYFIDPVTLQTSLPDARCVVRFNIEHPGDLNADGKVDIHDYNKIVANFGDPYTIFDYNVLVGNWGK